MKAHMKTILKIGAALLLVALLGGCYLELDTGAGDVGIQLPPSQSIAGTPPATTGRIYVLNGPNLVPLGTAGFQEFALEVGGQKLTEITVGPVPSGPGYQVVLVFGNIGDGAAGAETAKVFVPSQYALSAEFTVAAGVATPVDLDPAGTPFVPVGPAATLGRSLVGIINTSAGLYTASTTQLYQATDDLPNPVTFSAAAGGMVPDGRTINSLGLGAFDGASVPWVNTNQGVLPYTGGILDATFDPEASAVLSSAAATIGANLYGYMQYDGGLRGVYKPGAGAAEWLDPIDLSSIVVGAPISDFAIAAVGTDFYGYFATKLGAFRLPDDVLTNPAIDTLTEVFEAAEFFTVTIGGTTAQITRIGLTLINPSHVYLGTPRGAVRVLETALGSETPIVATLIPGTEGRAVRSIAVGGSYVAILTDHFLSVSNDGGASFAAIPVMASSVGSVTGMFMTDGILLISGSLGVVGVEIDDIIP